MRAAFALVGLILLAACDRTASAEEQAVKLRLRDPESAQFRNVRPCERLGVNGVRGEVNAKNSTGGYAGFAYFISINGDVAILSLNEGAGDTQMYPTPAGHWDALFRQCNTDEANQAVDNASRAADASALSNADNAAHAAEAAAVAADNAEREAVRSRSSSGRVTSHGLDDPMRNTAPDN